MRLRRTSRFVAIAFLTVCVAVPAAQAQLAAQAQATPAPHDLKMIADQPMIAIWMRPDQHLRNPALAQLWAAISKTAPESTQKALATSIPKMDLLKVSMNPGKRVYSENEQPIPVVVMHLTEPAAAKTIFEDMSKNYKAKTYPALSVPVYQYDYKPIDHSDGAPEEDKSLLRNGMAQLDPLTIINGSTVEKLIEVATAKTPTTGGAWASDFAASNSAPALMLIDGVVLRKLIEPELKRRPPRGSEAIIINGLKPLWESADYALLTADTADGIKITGLARSPTPDAAVRFKGTLEGAVAMGKGFLPMLKPQLAQLHEQSPGLAEKIYQELETALNSATITQDGTTTKLNMHIKQDCANNVVAGFFVPLLEQEIKRMEEQRARFKAETNAIRKEATKEAIPALPEE